MENQEGTKLNTKPLPVELGSANGETNFKNMRTKADENRRTASGERKRHKAGAWGVRVDPVDDDEAAPAVDDDVWPVLDDDAALRAQQRSEERVIRPQTTAELTACESP